MVKNKKRKLNVISRIVAIILLLVSILFVILLLSINILPHKYLYIIIGITIFLVLINFLLLYFNKIKKKIKKKSLLMSFIMIIIFTFGSFYLIKTFSFVNNLMVTNKADNYYVIVLKESNYTELKELSNKKIGILKSNLSTSNDALSILEEKINYQKEEFDTLADLWNKLINNEIEVIFLSNSYYNLLENFDELYVNKIKIINTIKISEKHEDIVKDVNITEESFNILISGMDTSGEIELNSNSDVNMIVTVNPVSKKILLTSIPRDYYVSLYGKTDCKDKLTHAGIYGIDVSVKTIEKLLNIDINYYIKVNFTTLIKLVDVIGGIDVYSKYSFVSYVNPDYYYVKGYNYLNGDKALAFSRERNAFIDGDRTRVENQQRVIEAIIEKMTKNYSIIVKYSSILDSIDGAFATNVPTEDIYKLIQMQLNDMPTWEIEKNSLDGSDSSGYTCSIPGKELWVMEPNEDTINIANKKILEIMK